MLSNKITMKYVLVALNAFVNLIAATVAANFGCCDYVGTQTTSGGWVTPCKNTCMSGDVTMTSREQLAYLGELHASCPSNGPGLRRFWTCVNNSFAVVNAGVTWEGRTCCWKAISEQCQSACEEAHSRTSIKGSCPVRSEQTFYQCLQRQETSIECCQQTNSAQCRSICKAIFEQESLLTSAQNETLAQQCPQEVTKCVWSYSQQIEPEDPKENLPCCEKSDIPECRLHCQKALNSMKDEMEIIEYLVQYCGHVMIDNEDLWTCFLMTSSTNNGPVRKEELPPGTIEMAGMDAAKLHCCYKAKTSKCETLCAKTHGRSFATHVDQFDADCRLSTSENELNQCLDEVSEPCTLGCNGLQFCSNFNNRPLEMFRSCNSQADQLAELTFNEWTKGLIHLPSMNPIPVKDIRVCHPEWWQSIACALQVKPCKSQIVINRICYDDCIRVLGECMNKSGLDQYTLCESLAPVDGQMDQECIHLGHYLKDSPFRSEPAEINHPCVPNPCNKSEICVIKRSKCASSQNCQAFTCEPGCQLGEVSSLFAPVNSMIRLPKPNRLDCHRMCKCNNQGLLYKCQELGCIKQDDCHIGTGRIHNHETQFELGCNNCFCYNGELICTKQECFSQDYHGVKGYTGLPCNCDTQFLPVCGGNGQVYWNPCLARCAISNDPNFQYGSCISLDPCKNNPCSRNQVCVPRHQKCLQSLFCPQYECIDKNKDCNTKDSDPVCSSDGSEYVNICLLFKNGGQLAYWGRCREGCDPHSGMVCGMDRETYISECHAWAAHVLVDYYGSCRFTPALVGKTGLAHYVCHGVICPSISSTGFCEPITPVGVCCPVCASEIRVLYSNKIIQSMLQTNLGLKYSISDIIRSLNKHISTAQCDLFAYISIEQDLVLLVSATTKYPTPIQIDACSLEAKKLNDLISNRASVVQIIAETSPFLVSSLKTPFTNPFTLRHNFSAGVPLRGFPLTLYLFIIFVTLLKIF